MHSSTLHLRVGVGVRACTYAFVRNCVCMNTLRLIDIILDLNTAAAGNARASGDAVLVYSVSIRPLA